MSTVIVQVMPIWAREDIVMALTGIPQNTIRMLSNEGMVRARKMDANKAKSAVVFRVQDVLDWLEEHADKPGKYVIAGADT